MDLFSQFASQFKPKEEPKAEPKEKTTQEIRDRNDRYEAYRKAYKEPISMKAFIALEERENAVEGLESMSQFEKKQRRLADKQRLPTDIEKFEIVIDSIDEQGNALTERMEPIKEHIAFHPAISHVNCSPNITPETVQAINQIAEKVIEYSNMPEGLKDLQKLNGINNHDDLVVEPLLDEPVTFEQLDEPIVKEKKIRVFKKDFPTPERTQTVKQRAYVGIDNGVSGSVGIIYEDGTYEFFVTPVKKEQDYTKAKKLINRVQPLELAELFKYVGEGSMVMIERPMINSTRFNASMSAIRCFEATITILETLGLPYQVEDSKAWQKALLPIGISGDDLKKASKDVGNRLFPNTKLILHPDCDGMLIANYCKSKHR